MNLADLYIKEGKYDIAARLLEECRAEGMISMAMGEWIEELEEIIKEKRSR